MAYSKGAIAIANVTGDIVITVTTVLTQLGFTNVLPLATDTDGTVYDSAGYKQATRINSSGNAVSITEAYYSSSLCTTGFIPCTVGDKLRLAGMRIDPADAQAGSYNIAVYDSSKTKLAHSSWTNLSSCATVETDANGYVTSIALTEGKMLGAAGTAFIRISAFDMDSMSAISVNEEMV